MRICGQCCLYTPAISVSLLGTRFEGIRTGSASQLEPGVVADVGTGSDAVLVLAWSDLLVFLTGGASVLFSAAGRFRAVAGCGVDCPVRI